MCVRLAAVVVAVRLLLGGVVTAVVGGAIAAIVVAVCCHCCCYDAAVSRLLVCWSFVIQPLVIFVAGFTKQTIMTIVVVTVTVHGTI